MNTVEATETLDLRHAIWEALDEELAADPNVIFFGEDVAIPGGVFQVTPGLRDRHGADRVFDTPISELALSSAAFGSAAAGLRPVIEIMFADFLPLVMDSVLNQATKFRFFSNGAGTIPLVIRTTVGGGGQFGAIHSQIPTPWFQSFPGLKIVAPATANDAKALLRASVQDDDPVLFLEHKRLYTLAEPRLESDATIGKANVVRPGSDITIVSSMKSLHDSLEAAGALAAEGIDVEVIDLRTVRPIDSATIIQSLERTSRLLVVDEGPRTGGTAAEVLSLVTELGLGFIDDAWTLTAPNTPIPYSPPLEEQHLPGSAAIVASIKQRAGVVA